MAAGQLVSGAQQMTDYIYRIKRRPMYWRICMWASVYLCLSVTEDFLVILRFMMSSVGERTVEVTILTYDEVTDSGRNNTHS